MNEDVLTHELYMNRALKLASQGLGNTYPNPLVGAVVVCQNRIIGEGFHCQAGEPHAEVNAINRVSNHEMLNESTLYVNLEPCAHFGKTPPCSLLIIEKKVPRVVIGCMDTFSEVSGKGIEMLRNAGIEVIVGVLERESRWLNRRFFTYHEKKRPYVILKWAETQDGFIDQKRVSGEIPKINWITNALSRRVVHQQRAQEQAVFVGTNTALNDNPSLTVRDYYGNQPLRVVLDKSLRLPKSLHLFDGTVPTLVFTEKEAAPKINVEYVKIRFDEYLLEDIFNDLVRRGIQSIIVEGGSQLIQTFVDANKWDEAHVYVGPVNFGDGILAPQLKKNEGSTYYYDDSKKTVFHNNLLT